MNFIPMKRWVAAGLFLLATQANAQPLSEKMAATVMDIWKDSLVVTPGRTVKWSYDQGVVLEGIDAVWKRTGNADYFKYLQKSMDHYVGNDGVIRTYKQEDYNIDNIKNGRSLLSLYKITGQEKYLKACRTLYEQLQKQPRTNEGGFWHKKIYPYQMWLDGLYMGEPFYTEFAALIHDQKAFDDIANQFIFMEKHARDPKTGLLYHGWDESKQQQWANKTTGVSPNFWGRAMGWYGMALVDVLDYFPEDHPKRKELIAILSRFVTAVQKVQEAKSGLWYDVLDKPTAKGNYHEASEACMFVYAVAKGVRNGYLPASAFSIAEKGYEGIKKEFIEEPTPGKVILKGTVSVSGLGGNPYRDGSYEYYIREKVVTNDAKGVGAFIQAANEMELATWPKPGKNKVVTLDSWYNNETATEKATGAMEPFHYVWPERDLNGFSFFGQTFTYRGAKLATLETAPTATNLKGTDVYIIVDPDTEKETAKPNFMNAKDAGEIASWVQNGGVLLLLANDAPNAELTQFNTLSEKFGIHFNNDSENKVAGSQYEQGAIAIQPGNPVFKTAKKAYIKELSTLALSGPAKAVLVHNGKTVVASAAYGKGAVLAVGDPWFYNEYTDGRKLPASFENFSAANDVAQWLLSSIPPKNK
jgi:unsaturated rhamnogalacturonyl hydrolase